MKRIMMQASQSLGKRLSPLVLLSVLCMQGCVGNRSHDTQDSYLNAVVSWAQSLVGRKKANYDINTIFTKENVIPLVIIGSGPAGLGAGLYGARDNKTTLIIEGENPGGLLMYTTEVENWGGRKMIKGPEIIKELREHVEEVGAHFLVDSVEKVDFNQWPFVISTIGNKTIHALAVVVATGASPRKLNIPGEQEYWGRGVTACAVCDAHFFKGEDVVVVGGGDSAVEEAIQLANHVRSVTILVRGDRMRAAASSYDRLKQYPTVHILYNVQIEQIVGDDETAGQGQGKVVSITLLNNKTKEKTKMPTAGVFLAIGHVPNSSLFKNALALDEHGYVKVMDCTHKTSVPGVFAAGEIEDHRYKQAWSSGGRGTEAALDALAFLREVGFNPTIAERLSDQGQVWQITEDFEVPSMVSEADLQAESAKSSEPIILDFWSKDCPGCLAMMPTFKAIAHEYKDSIKFFKVDAAGDIEHVSDLVPKYHIAKIPSFLVFKDGKLVARYTGTMNKKEFEAFVKKFLNPRDVPATTDNEAKTVTKQSPEKQTTASAATKKTPASAEGNAKVPYYAAPADDDSVSEADAE